MSILDRAAEWIRQVLAFGSPEFVAGAWLPVFAVALFVAAMLVVRKLLPLAAHGGVLLLNALFTLAGAALLVPDLVVAWAARAARGRPPALLYHYGDAVAAGTAGLTRVGGTLRAGLGRVARMHWFLVLLLCAGLIWTWDHSHCPATAPGSASCVRPFAGWLGSFGDKKAPPPPHKVVTRPAKHK